jgi:hypothetical protein
MWDWEGSFPVCEAVRGQIRGVSSRSALQRGFPVDHVPLLLCLHLRGKAEMLKSFRFLGLIWIFGHGYCSWGPLGEVSQVFYEGLTVHYVN